MNTDQIKTFIAVAQNRSFTKASSELFVAQSTITNRIKELEKDVGQQLFIRRDKQFELTEAGGLFMDYALNYLDLEKKIKADIYNCKRYVDTISIGSVKCIYESHLRPLLNDYMTENEDISLNVIMEHSRMVMGKLSDNVIDIAFSYIPLVEQNYICKLFRNDDILLVSSSRNLVHVDEIKKEEIIKLPIIYSKFTKTPGYDWMDDIFPPLYRFRMNMSVLSEIVFFLLNGPYYAFIPKPLIKKELDSGLLKETKIIDFEIPKLKSYAIIKGEKHLDLLEYFVNN